jgi:hypothetical protein
MSGEQFALAAAAARIQRCANLRVPVTLPRIPTVVIQDAAFTA